MTPHRSYSCLIVEPTDGPSVKVQIRRQLEYKIAIGALRPGEQLPTSAALAAQLGVNQNTVRAAYDELKANGLITSATRDGSHVADDARSAELLQSVARTDLSPAIGTARSIGCTRRDVVRVVADLLNEWYPAETKASRRKKAAS